MEGTQNHIFTLMYTHLYVHQTNNLLPTYIRTATALRIHMRIVFEERSSWTALTMYIGMKTTF